MKKLTVIIILLLNIIGCAQKGVDSGPSVTYFPAPPAEPKIQFLTSIRAGTDLKQMSTLESILLGPDQDRIELNKTYDIASSPGRIYAVNRNLRKVLVVDLVEKKIYPINDTQTRESEFVYPGGIWATPDGRLYVTDIERNEVIAFDSNGKFLKTYGDKDYLIKAVDVAVFEDNIYVSDMKKNQIVIFNRQSGKRTGAISQTGDVATGLFGPTHVSVDDKGDIYVTDGYHFNVKKFSPDGQLLKYTGYHGDSPGAFARPKGNAVSPDDNLYVLDAAFENVQIFNQEGQLLLFFGGPGLAPGRLNLPTGIFIDKYNVEYFSEFVDERFQVDFLILVSSMMGAAQLNVYGFGTYE